MLEIVNEPLNWDKAVDSLRNTYYPNAYKVAKVLPFCILRCSYS
jgi:hypothetical protein